MRQRGLPGSTPTGTTGLFSHDETATPRGVPARPAEASSFDVDFAEFWKAYPRRVKPLAARKAYEKARKEATAEAILAGAMLYAQNCPRDPTFQAHPTSWLNQGRWMDELPGIRKTQAEDWYEACGRLHNHECGLSRWRHQQRVDVEAFRAEDRAKA